MVKGLSSLYDFKRSLNSIKKTPIPSTIWFLIFDTTFWRVPFDVALMNEDFFNYMPILHIDQVLIGE